MSEQIHISSPNVSEVSSDAELFWGAPVQVYPGVFQAGTTHAAGSWGHVFDYRQSRDQPHLAAREWMLDWVRIQYYPRRPSRFACTFSCLSLADAVQFQCTRGGAQNGFRIYRARLESAQSPTFVSDYTFYGMSEWDTWATMKEKAHKYWTGGRTKHSEVVSESGLVLEGMVSIEEVQEKIISMGFSFELGKM